MTRQQQIQLDAYIKKLGITTEGELFVLKHILQRDWHRDILLQDIAMIKYNDPQCPNLIWIKCKTRNGSYNFEVPDVSIGEWTTRNTQTEREVYVDSQLRHKMD